MKKLVLSILCMLALSINALAQKTPQELGQYIFKALRSENIKAVHSYIATPEEVLIFSKKLGKNYSSQEAEDFKKDQIETDSAFTRKCRFVLDDGKQRSIEWNKTELVEVKSLTETYQLSSLDESKTIEFGPIEIIFSYADKKYVLTLETAFDAIGRWRISGEKLTLASYKE